MLFDNGGIFSDSQAVTATAVSTNSLDLRPNGKPIGNVGALVGDVGDSDVEIMFMVTEDFNNLTSLKVALEMDDNSAFSSPTVVASSEAIPAASLKAGYKFRLPNGIPQGTTERFIQARYTVDGIAPTTGKIFAGVVLARGSV